MLQGFFGIEPGLSFNPGPDIIFMLISDFAVFTDQVVIDFGKGFSPGDQILCVSVHPTNGLVDHEETAV